MVDDAHTPNHSLMLICALLVRSDADSDVLADYVLALIRADTSEQELKANAIENLEDFLRESAYLPSVLD